MPRGRSPANSSGSQFSGVPARGNGFWFASLFNSGAVRHKRVDAWAFKTGVTAATAGESITISVPAGARQKFAGFGASMGNWEGQYQVLPRAQRQHLAKMFWRGLNFKILRLWFNVDDYSPTRGTHNLSLFRKQYVHSGVIADARANGVTTLLFAPDHIPPYMRSTDKVDGPINDVEVKNFVTLIAEAIRKLRDSRLHMWPTTKVVAAKIPAAINIMSY